MSFGEKWIKWRCNRCPCYGDNTTYRIYSLAPPSTITKQVSVKMCSNANLMRKPLCLFALHWSFLGLPESELSMTLSFFFLRITGLTLISNQILQKGTARMAAVLFPGLITFHCSLLMSQLFLSLHSVTAFIASSCRGQTHSLYLRLHSVHVLSVKISHTRLCVCFFF